MVSSIMLVQVIQMIKIILKKLREPGFEILVPLKYVLTWKKNYSEKDNLMKVDWMWS